MTRVLTWLYATLLRFYPRQFHTEFSEEMQSVFEDAIKMQSGQWSSLLLLFHELHDLPGSLFEAYAAERPYGWETTMKNRIIYFFGLVVLGLGVWVSVSMYMGLLNLGTFIALVVAAVLVALPLSPVIRGVSYKIWVFVGFIVLVGLILPPIIYRKILPAGDVEPFTSSVAFTILSLISIALVIIALLIKFILQIIKKLRDTNTGKVTGIKEQSEKPNIAAIFILVLIVLLGAKAFHSFYWFLIWDSTTDSLDVLWLPIPILAVIFSSFLLYFLLPEGTKPKGFLYLLMIPVLIGLFNLAEQVDFRQLTHERAEHVSQLIESYQGKSGHYPKSLQELTPRYALSIPGPVIIFGQDWCYDGGENYYRLGYVYRQHWSDPRLIGKIYKTRGELPDLQPMCEKEVAIIQKRHPDYPYEYWVDGE
jgi:hypothetical protein